ncbi:Protein FAM123C [Aix galericulata]|nr:Protein FAM123C [Aix galericulata]
MELKRGKTFIKSSVQHEKVPPEHTASANKNDIGKDKKAVLEGNQSVAEVQLAYLAAHKNYRFSTRAARNGAGDNSLDKSSGSSYKLVRKSKTHDCVSEAEKTEQCSPSNRACEEGFSGKGKGRLVNSISFSGMSSSSSKKECVVSPSQSACSSQMIDYRNFVPQMPFVPAVAKTIPRKRISLKRSKKGLRDIFHIKKNKPESLAFLVEKDKNLSSPGCKSELPGRLAKYLFKTGEPFAADCLSQDCSDSELQSDSSYDCCNPLCEDVASLKSFDSLTGCGEIFADESSAHLELENSKEVLLRRSKHKESPIMGSFQGGVEQLASPGQNETVEFGKFWDNINKSVRLHQSTLFDKKLLTMPGSDMGKTGSQAAASATDPQMSPDKDGDNSKESSTETGTPKSDNQESISTSDEGYYDSFSPGQDDEVKEAQTPGVPGRFPRDSYSGDALYELFYDSNEVKINPVLDDDLCTSESISEQAIEIPLSIYSFHVGAEENTASQPAVDIISQGFFHSTWKGKECLLKLCDTELSLTMGIINWLRKHSGLVSSPDSLQSPQPQPEKGNHSPIPPSPGPEHNMSTAQQEKQSKEDSFNRRVSVDKSKEASSVNVAEKDSCTNTSDLDFRGREGNHLEHSSTVPGTAETTGASNYAPQSQANGDNLQTSSTEKATSSEGYETSEDRIPLAEGLNRQSGSQSSESLLLNDNHEVESCYSYKTAATSPLDALEREDRNKPMYHSLSVCCDKPPQPLTLRGFQSYISPTPRESSTNIVQLLERCGFGLEGSPRHVQLVYGQVVKYVADRKYMMMMCHRPQALMRTEYWDGNEVPFQDLNSLSSAVKRALGSSPMSSAAVMERQHLGWQLSPSTSNTNHRSVRSYKTPEPVDNYISEGEFEDDLSSSTPSTIELEIRGSSQDTDEDYFETLSHQSGSLSDVKTEPYESASETESVASDRHFKSKSPPCGSLHTRKESYASEYSDDDDLFYERPAGLFNRMSLRKASGSGRILMEDTDANSTSLTLAAVRYADGLGSGSSENNDSEPVEYPGIRKSFPENEYKRNKNPEGKKFRARLALAHKSLSSLFESKSLEKENTEQSSKVSLKTEKEKAKLRQSTWKAFLKSKEADGLKRPVLANLSPTQESVNTTRGQLMRTTSVEQQDSSNGHTFLKTETSNGSSTDTNYFDTSLEPVDISSPADEKDKEIPERRRRRKRPKSLYKCFSFDDVWMERNQKRNLEKERQPERGMQLQHLPEDQLKAGMSASITSAGALDMLPLKLHPFSQSTPTGLDCMGWKRRISAPVIADGALDKTALTDDVGSEEDLYEDFRSSNHRYGHAGGGGEQLAINERLSTSSHAFTLSLCPHTASIPQEHPGQDLPPGRTWLWLWHILSAGGRI